MTRSWTSGSYEISCTARANEYKGKFPAICSSTTLLSTQQKVLSIISCNGKKRRIVPPVLPSPPISWAQRFRRRRPRPQPRMSLSRQNDLSAVVGGVRVTGQHFAQHVPIADFTFGPPESHEPRNGRLRASRNSVAPRSPAAPSTGSPSSTGLAHRCRPGLAQPEALVVTVTDCGGAESMPRWIDTDSGRPGETQWAKSSS